MQLSRRTVLTGFGALAAATAAESVSIPAARALESPETVAFYGPHQAGIETPPQQRLTFAAYDVAGGVDPTGLRNLLQTWTSLAERLTNGTTVGYPRFAPDAPADTGETFGVPNSNLTVTVGFGPALFDQRFGLGPRQPAALAELPPFPGDQLDPARSGGDLCVQACADDEQVSLHAIRMLTRHAAGAATLRWVQQGFLPAPKPGETTRNLMGFKDGTRNASGPVDFARHVWVDATDQPWMRGGSYLVARRIRMNLADWDAEPLNEQDDVFGRYKSTGAAYGQETEHATPLMPDLPADSHVRLASPETNGGIKILRRGYSYADTHLVEGDPEAGLFFLAYQADPGQGFIPLQQKLAAHDALNEYITHTGSAIFAVPPGIGPGGYWGQSLLS